MGSASSSQVKSIGDSANNATEDTITSVADNNNSQVIKTAKYVLIWRRYTWHVTISSNAQNQYFRSQPYNYE